jgi:DNA-binding XRE family transcriptional regulator
MKPDWFVSPGALARARLDQLLTQQQLADKSGVSVRSIRGYERKDQRVTLTILQLLAQTLSVEVRDIASLRTERPDASAPSADGKAPGRAGGKASVKAAAAPAPPATVLPPRTQLETLVDLEREAGIAPAALETARGPAEVLTAKRLQDVLTAYALYDGQRFSLTGNVEGMRGIAHAEAKLLGSRNGVAARFHVTKEIVPGQPFGVTVHSAKAEHTKLLQKNYGVPDVTLLLRVVLVPGEPADDGPGFSSFITRLATKRPWTFVIEEVVLAKVPARARDSRESVGEAKQSVAPNRKSAKSPKKNG